MRVERRYRLEATSGLEARGVLARAGGDPMRIDPLVRGSIVVFDRNICGFNAKSGHIEVITSIEPLRASSYKFHEVKLDCLIEAADSGKVHIYVPRRLDPRPAPETAAGGEAS